MKYTASLDPLSKVVTVSCFLFFSALTVVVFQNYAISYFSVAGVALLWAVLILCYGFAPRYYVVDKHNLQAWSRWTMFVWPVNEIREISLLSEPELRWAWRLIGVGGLFGYYGIFWHKNFGRMIWYGTQRKNYVLLTLDTGRKVVLTPDNPREFVAAFKK